MAAGVRDLQRKLIEGEPNRGQMSKTTTCGLGLVLTMSCRKFSTTKEGSDPQRIRRFIYFGSCEGNSPNRSYLRHKTAAAPATSRRIAVGGKASAILEGQWRETQSGPRNLLIPLLEKFCNSNPKNLNGQD